MLHGAGGTDSAVCDGGADMTEFTQERHNLMREALEAHQAWAIAEEKHLGDFDVRSELCYYANHLTEKALGLTVGDYEGVPHMIVFPECRMDRATKDSVRALVKDVLENHWPKQQSGETQ